MKKIGLLLLACFLLSACSGNDKGIYDQFKSDVNKAKSYELIGKMEMYDNEQTYNYDINVLYLKDDYYKVDMVNTLSSLEQVIIKNEDGLYVITPSLNKSFKFESNWPNNSSQSYILSSLISDIDGDSEREEYFEDDFYVIKTKVNYLNNKELEYQKVYFNKEGNLSKVEVYSSADIMAILFNVSSIKYNISVSKNEFTIDKYKIDKNCEDNICDQDVISKIENAIFPLYMPSNTYLSSSEVVNDDIESRVILTFSGEKNFVLVEEKTMTNDEMEIIPVYGDPIMLNDTIAAISNNSMYFTIDDIDYYLVSEDLSNDEMIFIASSLGNTIQTMATK